MWLKPFLSGVLNPSAKAVGNKKAKASELKQILPFTLVNG